jgi:DNA-binding HxlR family transcriptional regulator
VTNRLAGIEADLLSVHVDFPVFERLAKPVAAERTTIPGIKIHYTRKHRLMEDLLHGGSQLAGWRTAQMHRAVLEAFRLTSDTYSLTQLRYDVRKLRAHGLLEREGRSYSYRLTEKGRKVAALFVLFQKRVCGPLANTLFHHRPTKTATLPAKIEAAYHKADVAIQNVIDLLAA